MHIYLLLYEVNGVDKNYERIPELYLFQKCRAPT